MRIIMIAIGDELLDGRGTETNAARLAKRLRLVGLRLDAIHVIPDRLEVIRDTLQSADLRADFLVLSGGLGLTADDLTREAVASWLGDTLVEDPGARAVLETRLAARGRRDRDAERYALRPQSAASIPNPTGLASGFLATTPSGTPLLAFPGVPSEFDAMVDATLMPLLQTNRSSAFHQMTFFGLSERAIEEQVNALCLPDDIEVAWTVDSGLIRLSLRHPHTLTASLSLLRQQLAAYLIYEGDTSLAAQLIHLLTSRSQTIATAESCTGGLLASLITQVPGCSSAFLEGRVTYSNEAKIQLLGVQTETLECYGAVSRHTALEMAQGLRQRSHASWTIATTGIAGPDGGSEGKPVGLVHLAIAGPSGSWHRPLFYPARPRLLIQSLAANAALVALIALIQGQEPWPAPLLPDHLNLD